MGLWTCAIERSGGLRYRWETRLHRDRGVRGQRSAALPSSHRQHVPRSTVHSAPPRLLAKEREALSQAPQMRPSSPFYARGCWRQTVVPSSCAPTLKPRGTRGVKRIASRQTHNLPEQFCSSDDNPKKHCHPVNCFTAFCVLSNIFSGSKIEKNMEGREMSVSMVKYFSTNSICYACICLILYCIFITFTVRVGL